MTTLVGARCTLKVQLTTIKLALALHLPTQLTTIKVGPGLGTFFSSFAISLALLSPFWPPRPLESKVIRIQSDHPLAFSPLVAAMERSKVICSIQVWRRDVGLSSKVSLDFAGLGGLLLSPPSLPLTWCCSLQHFPSWRLTSWLWSCGNGFAWFPPWAALSPKTFWGGSCMHWRCFCYAVSPSLGLVKLHCAPTNRDALDLLFHWTYKATRNEFLYWVHGALSLICTFLDWDFRLTGSSLQARPGWLLLKLLCHRQSSLLGTRSFISWPCTIFDPLDFCHLRRRLII